MKPSIGRIVHYNSSHGTAAAIVILVHRDESIVNLQVFDPSGRIRSVAAVEQGDSLGQWNWPPRV